MKLDFFLKTPLDELINIASSQREEYWQQEIELCTIINAKSGSCSEDCKFCAQSRWHNSRIETYPLKSEKQILERAKFAKTIGAKKYGIVTSGRRVSHQEIKKIASFLRKIKDDIGIEPCCSLGAISKEDLLILKENGLTRFHHNIETSPKFYPSIVSTHSFAERLNTLKAAKEIGLEVCSGGILGLGETWQDRYEMALILKDIGVNSVPLNILIPVKGTALEEQPLLSGEEVLRTIAMFRIILKKPIIKIAAGREMVLGENQYQAFLAGANGMLIGGYLTIAGAPVEEDKKLIERVIKIWKNHSGGKLPKPSFSAKKTTSCVA